MRFIWSQIVFVCLGIHATLCTCTRQRHQRRRRFRGRFGGLTHDDNMDISVNEDCLTDIDSTSYDSSYYGTTSTDNRMRKRKSEQQHTPSEIHDNYIEVLGTAKSNMFRELNIRRKRNVRNKQNSIIMDF